MIKLIKVVAYKRFLRKSVCFKLLDEERFLHNGLPFTGIAVEQSIGEVIERRYVNGIYDGLTRFISGDGYFRSEFYLGGTWHGYHAGFPLRQFGSRQRFHLFDAGEIIESLGPVVKGEVQFNFFDTETPLDNIRRNGKIQWQLRRKDFMEEGYYDGEEDLLPYFIKQEQIKRQVSQTDELAEVKFVAGADVAYNELEQRMVGALVVLDAQTLEVVDQAIHEMDITFPYVPGLFSFREVPPLLEAYKKLQIKPDLIVCDGHGVAHPKGAGMASHLGIELDVPTIGCAKSRLIGGYDELGIKRGAYSALMHGDKEIGRVLRTQDNIKPMFVSVGHKVSLDTACEWILKLSPKYRQPETTRKADALVRTVMKERTDIGYPEE